MNKNERTSENSGVIISNEVIASIAMEAAKDVEGFGSFDSRTSGSKKSVKVTTLDNDIRVQMNIRVCNDANIQDVSLAIQRSVKNAVQSMTGKVVSKVNVCIQGIDFYAPNETKEQA